MTATSARRRSPRLVLAGIAVGAGAALALAGCSSGQIAQTAQQTAPVPGINVNVGEQVALRNLVIEYNGPTGYAAGSNAPLVVRLFNNGTTPISLVGVASEGSAAVQLVGTPEVVTPTETPPAASTSTPPASATGSPAPETSATGSPEPTATTQAPTQPAATLSITIPPHSFVLLVPGEGAQGYLQLTGLTAPVVPGGSVTVTFTFSDGSSATAAVPLAPPTGVVPRGTPVVAPEHAEAADF